MDKLIYERTVKEAKHIIDTDDTIRTTAKKFNISKSTVFMDLNQRLKEIDNSMFKEVSSILKKHDEDKHIRGGEVTKQKYRRG